MSLSCGAHRNYESKTISRPQDSGQAQQCLCAALSVKGKNVPVKEDTSFETVSSTAKGWMEHVADKMLQFLL